MKPDAETIRDVIARFVARCASSGKSVLVVWSKDRKNPFVPQEEGLRLHQDSIEFVDEDGTPTALPYSSIARIELDEDDVLAKSATIAPFPKQPEDGA